MTTTVTRDQRPVERLPTAKSHTRRTILLAVGLALLLFSCFLTYGLFATATGWISDLSTDNSEASYTYYDRQRADRFPINNPDERRECLARYWRLLSIETEQRIIYECQKPGRQP